jgi:4a-hydroxytetrahydrobiopterin dehydratase
MADREPLSAGEIRAELPEGWSYDADADEVVRTYEFEDYLDGVDFASEVGDLAEEEFHHPTITIRYGEVEVRFTDHEAGGVSATDIEMAERCNERRAA